MESARYTIKITVQANQELDFDQGTCNINQYVKRNAKQRHFLNNKHEKARYFNGYVSHASKFSAHICFCRKKFFHVEIIVGQGQKFYG